MAGRKVGLKSAVELVYAARTTVPARARAQQLDLLPLKPTAAIADEPAPRQPETRAAKGGRPKGATNIATRELRDYMLGRYRSPLIAMAETYARPVHELARALHCTLLEAFQLQQAAARDLAPYLHQKLTPLDALPPGSGFRLEIITGPDAQPGDGAQPVGGVVIDSKENQ
jgi:hypothetical protein